MKTSNLELLAQKFCQAARVQSGSAVLIAYNDTVSEEIIRACKREAERADAAHITLYNNVALPYEYTFQIQTKHAARVPSWMIGIAPNGNLGDVFNMNADDAEEMYVRMCTLDYAAMTDAMKPLANLMGQTKDVRITGPETDLTFQLEDIPAVAIAGIYNIPCGECFSAPVKDSLNGMIKFGISQYHDQNFEFVQLAYENGRVIEALAENDERTAALNAILDTDEGARFVGEFAIACNPYVANPIGNALLDEKIFGSLHLAQGHCLKDFAPNENTDSRIHWDIVQIQRPEFGGGEIWFDGELIRKDGLFLPEDLQALNPENLKLII